MDYILRYEDAFSTETDGYAVFYPNDGYLTDTGSLDSARLHHDNLAHIFPDSYVVRVRIERV